MKDYPDLYQPRRVKRAHADARRVDQKAVEDFRPDHDNGPTCMGCHGRSRGSNPAKEGALHERTVLLGCEAV